MSQDTPVYTCLVFPRRMNEWMDGMDGWMGDDDDDDCLCQGLHT